MSQLNSMRDHLMGTRDNAAPREPWNKGTIVGQKAQFKLKDIWALGVNGQNQGWRT